MNPADVQVRHDKRRGCGLRKPGGIYLVCDGYGEACAALPIPVPVCPACGSGIHPTRGWSWIRTDVVLAEWLVPHEPLEHSRRCPLSEPGRLGERVGLLWVGEAFYKTPQDFAREAAEQGISRRIAAVPRGFQLGQWVMLAHRKAIAPRSAGQLFDGHADGCTCQGIDAREGCELDGCTCPVHHAGPGIFHVFRPRAIEYVCRGDETPEQLDDLVKRGLTPVRVEARP